MSGSHGDLFHEIGKLVLAAHAGQAIDLAAKSEELSERYDNLGMPADMLARAIARSLGAIGVSMAVISSANQENNGANGEHADGKNGHHVNGQNGHHASGNGHAGGKAARSAEADIEVEIATQPVEAQAKAASALFPSGLRLAVLS